MPEDRMIMDDDDLMSGELAQFELIPDDSSNAGRVIADRIVGVVKGEKPQD